ncbi:predicted protein [Chaetomium globosum CBS 148.51]|uniref:Uncharacterized protein n=1 Tax=Chaetomium globosum (strain ATCC 6205 / CBS 148.51 / DSM 1962 / NBRC 6347 / NRRL 1970) TaxID=306901 RepID=Q2HGI5_CHAGB|nr:uncharacterized protein CHGG_00669 [Chaetomium globosum CBS 148.51]EAQ92434.1 predicted protein [Chaetomium globosum CBS 148.51]
MTDPKGQQTGAHGPGSPEAQIAIPQIVIQPANNSDEISPIAHHLAQRGRPIPPSDRNFLEVPRPSRQSNRRASSHRRSSSKSRRPFGPGNLPLSLTGPVEAFHVPIDPLRMHPTGLTNSSTSPAATATDNPPGLRFDGNPFTPHGREVMAKVEKMLAANKELKPEPEGFKFSHLLESSFYKKLTSPTRLFSKSKPKQPIKPHQIRHVVSLEPLPTPDEIPRVPSPRLRQNERINVQKREKALQVLGETPQFGAVPASDPARSPPSSAEDPFAESSSRGATRAPTAFETRLRTTKSAGALLSGPTADPFQTERKARQGPRTTTTGTATTTNARTATSGSFSQGRSAPVRRKKISTWNPVPSARPEQRHARPCADAGSEPRCGELHVGAAAAAATNTTTPTAADNVAGAVVAGAADEGGSGAVERVAGVVPRLALSLRWVSSGRRRGWVWAEEEERKEGGEGEEELPWWEEDGAGPEEEEGRGRRRAAGGVGRRGRQVRVRVQRCRCERGGRLGAWVVWVGSWKASPDTGARRTSAALHQAAVGPVPPACGRGGGGERRRLPGPLRGLGRRVPRRGGRSRLFGTGPPPRARKMANGGRARGRRGQ